MEDSDQNSSLDEICVVCGKNKRIKSNVILFPTCGDCEYILTFKEYEYITNCSKCHRGYINRVGKKFHILCSICGKYDRSYNAVSTDAQIGMSDLPNELLYKIFDYVSARHLLLLEMVNKHFKNLIIDNSVWLHQLQKVIPDCNGCYFDNMKVQYYILSQLASLNMTIKRNPEILIANVFSMTDIIDAIYINEDMRTFIYFFDLFKERNTLKIINPIYIMIKHIMKNPNIDILRSFLEECDDSELDELRKICELNDENLMSNPVLRRELICYNLPKPKAMHTRNTYNENIINRLKAKYMLTNIIIR